MSLFIGNVSKNVRRQDLVDAFEKFGKCEVNIKVSIRLNLLMCPFLFLPVILFFSYCCPPRDHLLPIGILRFH